MKIINYRNPKSISDNKGDEVIPPTVDGIWLAISLICSVATFIGNSTTNKQSLLYSLLSTI